MEEVSTKQPEGYVASGKEDWVWRLVKGLYGLVQAGRTWNEELNAHIESEGLAATPNDPTMYIKNSWTDRDFVAADFWVDNYVAISSRKELTALVGSVNMAWEKSDGYSACCRSATAPARTISISQEASIDSIITRFNLTDATTVATPLTPGTYLSAGDCPTSKDEIEEMANRPYRGFVGALSWLTLGTRPDIGFATSSPSRFGHNPGRVHWDVAKRVVRYLTGTKQWRPSPWEASPRRSPSSQMLTGEVTATTDAQSERISSRSEMEPSA